MSDNKNSSPYASLTGFKRAVPIVLLALAAFIALCFITKETTGALGEAISKILLGLFARGAYLIPVLLALHAIFFASDVIGGRLISRIIFSLTALISLCAVIYTFNNFGTDISYSASQFYNDGVMGIGGGFIGSTVAFGIIKIFGHVGLIIIAAVVIALYISYFFAKGRGAARRSLLGILLAIVNFGAKCEKKLTGVLQKVKNKKKKGAKISKEHTAQLTDDDYFAVNDGLREISIPALGIHEIKSSRSLEENPSLEEKVYHKSAEDVFAKTNSQKDSFGFDGISKRFSSHDSDANNTRPTGERASFGLDCSADEIFTKDFSPIDFALDSDEANRPSTKSAPFTAPSASSDEFPIKEKIDAISERDIEMARRKADFDMKKRAAFESLKSDTDTEKTVNTQYSGAVYEKRSSEFINEVNREYTSTVHIPKSKPSNSIFEKEDTEHGADKTAENNAQEDSFAYRKDRYCSQPQAKEEAPDAVSHESEDLSIEADINEGNAYSEKCRETSTNSFAENDSISTVPPDLYGTDTDDSHGSDDDARYDEAEEAPVNTEKINVTRSMLSPTPTVLELIPDDDEKFEFLEEEAEEEEAPVESDEPDAEDAATELNEPLKNLYTYSDELDKNDEPFSRSQSETVARGSKIEENKENKPKKPDYSKYKYPSLDLLKKGDSSIEDGLSEEMEENGNKIIETLASFDVLASIKGYDRGPRITRYEVVPGPKVRVNQVVNLFDDISLSLATEGIRIEAPIPGKSAIGFELPNKTPETVRLRDLIECDEFKNAPSKTLACIGKDVTGSPVFGDIAKMPHVLIAGATGMGKSVCINSILISILYRARPDEVKFILIDPKKVEFKMYNGIPHLLVPVVSDAKQAAGALMWACEEMERRYDLIESLSVRNIEGYNERVRENPKLGDPLPKLIIVIDELNDLMLQVRDPVEGLIMSISQKARAAGIHLIIGTQRPSVNVITGVIKANIPSRMSCKVASYTDSKTIIERAGAEKLLDKGDMLYHPVGTPKPVRVQSAFVSDSEVYAVMDALKENADMVSYDDKVMEDITRAAQKCVKSKGGAAQTDRDDEQGAQDAASFMRDKQFLDAVDLAVTAGKISTSLIQRRIGVGYSKAAKFIDNMESLGIVSEPNGQKPRETLITKDEWLERLANY